MAGMVTAGHGAGEGEEGLGAVGDLEAVLGGGVVMVGGGKTRRSICITWRKQGRSLCRWKLWNGSFLLRCASAFFVDTRHACGSSRYCAEINYMSATDQTPIAFRNLLDRHPG